MRAMAAMAPVAVPPIGGLHNRAVQPGGTAFTATGRGSALQSVGDDQLVLLLRGREVAAERALDELYARYSSAVFGLAQRMLRDERAAEEVLQETFWRMWRDAARYEPGRVRPATWLLRIAHNLAVSELRRREHRSRMNAARPADVDEMPGGARDLPEVVDLAPGVAEQESRAEQHRALGAGLAELPVEQRQAVELAYYGGQTRAEIAAAQGVAPSTVETRLALGLRALAASLRTQRNAPEGARVPARGEARDVRHPPAVRDAQDARDVRDVPDAGDAGDAPAVSEGAP